MKGPNIPHRWLAEETAVFAIELAGAFVSDLKAGTRRVQTIQKHVAPRCLQSKLLLILKRTHGGQHPEMMVEADTPYRPIFGPIYPPVQGGTRICHLDPALAIMSGGLDSEGW